MLEDACIQVIKLFSRIDALEKSLEESIKARLELESQIEVLENDVSLLTRALNKLSSLLRLFFSKSS